MKKLWEVCGRVAFWLTWPGSWLYLRNTERTRVIITAGDKVLLVRAWFGAGRWGLPGGGIKKGEDPQQAAQREVREETGLDIDSAQLKFIKAMPIKEYGITHRCLLYRVELSKAHPPTRGREIHQVAWLPSSGPGLSPATKQLLDA